MNGTKKYELRTGRRAVLVVFCISSFFVPFFVLSSSFLVPYAPSKKSGSFSPSRNFT
jgi:hypothetical protein